MNSDVHQISPVIDYDEDYLPEFGGSQKFDQNYLLVQAVGASSISHGVSAAISFKHEELASDQFIKLIGDI